MAANKVLIANIKGPKGDPGPPGTFSEVDLARLSDVETRLDVTATKNELTSGLGQKANADDVYSLIDAKVDVEYVQNELDLRLSGISFDGLVENTDPRLSDARQPTDHRHAQSDIDDLALVLASKMSDSQVQALISAALSALVSDAPTTLDTLGEISDALASGDGAVSALTTLVGQKADAAITSTALASKLDKISSANTYRRAYAIDADGAQATYPMAASPLGLSLLLRDQNGNAYANDATSATQLVTKGQVDTALESKIQKNSSPTTNPQAYVKNAAGALEMVDIVSDWTTSSSIVRRTSAGQIYVAPATHDVMTPQLQQTPRRYKFSPGSSNGQRRYVRLATIDGVSTLAGGYLQFILAGSGDYGSATRGLTFVTFGQRGDNNCGVQAWGMGRDASADPVEFYTRQISTWVFELWGLFADWNQENTVIVLADSAGSNGTVVTINLDSQTITRPVFTSETPWPIIELSTIQNKVDRVISTGSDRAYIVNSSGATTVRTIANEATPWTLPQRLAGGEVAGGTATDPTHLVPKGQMDAAISGLYPGVVYSQTEPVVTEPTLWVQTDEAGTPVGVWTVLQ